MELIEGLIQGIVSGNWLYFQVWLGVLRVKFDPILCWKGVPNQLTYQLVLGLAFWCLVILGLVLYKQIKELKQA